MDYAQEYSHLGPRAGIGYLSKRTRSGFDTGLHSAFGWQMEIPYKGKEITGYGEAGLYLLAIEQGKIYTHVWGYFGARYNNIGIGVGPVFNTLGTGLGLNTYYQIVLDGIRIPIGIDVNFIDNKTRLQFFVGFNYN